MRTPDGLTCRFDAAPAGPGPAEIAATCSGGAQTEIARLRIVYAESARALLIEGGPFGDAGLIRCAE